MSYVKIVDYAAKDDLLAGNPSKVVKGTELGAEFDAIATASATTDSSITSKANKGANSDITSLTGLTTPLSTAQGGTGATSLSAANIAASGANADITSLTALTELAVNGRVTSTHPGGGGAGGIGYATGAGGQVTQLTSKSTAVTLNTLSGVIVMHNASLAANTAVSFTLNNTSHLAADIYALNTYGTSGNYSVRAEPFNGGATITLKNETGGALADAVTIRYAVIKVVNS